MELLQEVFRPQEDGLVLFHKGLIYGASDLPGVFRMALCDLTACSGGEVDGLVVDIEGLKLCRPPLEGVVGEDRGRIARKGDPEKILPTKFAGPGKKAAGGDL